MFKSLTKIKCLIFGLLMLPVCSLSARSIVIKLASLAPAGSPWDVTLHEMAEEWYEISGGEVELKIYPGGIMGSEEDVIRKMRIGQVDGALLTTMGMTQIVPETFVFSLPFFLQSQEELDYVLDELFPMFEDDFSSKGFQVLTFGETGWVKLFSTEPVMVPNELKELKLGVNSSESQMIQAFRSLGFNIVPADAGNMMITLQSGAVEAFYSPAMAAASFQWFALAPNMLDFNISPVFGGLILSNRAWSRIPRQYHDDILEYSKQVQLDFSEQTDDMNDYALDIMRENGLTVHSIPESSKRLWRNIFLMDNYSAIVGDGKTVPLEIYNEVKDSIESFRD